MTTSFRTLRLIVLLALVPLAACMPKGYRLKQEIYWPPPPDDPRIEYIESFYGSNFFPPRFSHFLVNWIVGDDPAQTLRQPIGVTADDAGNVYVSDQLLGSIFMLDRENDQMRVLADHGQAKLIGAGGLAFHNPRKELYAVDMARKAVLVIDPERNELKRMYAGAFSKPVALAVDEARDRLAVADSAQHKVFIVSALTGEPIVTVGGVGKEEGRLYYPLGVAFDADGRLYVSDSFNFRVQIFTPEGAFESTFGQIGTLPGQFARPKGIGVDSEKHVYVADAAFGNIQVFDAENGNLLLYLGNNGTQPGEFQLPQGIFIDKKNRIYAVDQMNGRVEIFQFMDRSESKRRGESLRNRVSQGREAPQK